MARSSRRPLVQLPMTIWWTCLAGHLGDGLDVVHGVRAGDLGRQLGHVDLHHLLVDRVGVRLHAGDRALDARLLPQVAQGLLVGRARCRRWRRPPRSCCRWPGGRWWTSSRMVSPWNSSTRKLAPWAVRLPIRCRIRSLGPTMLRELALHHHLDGGGHFDVQGDAQGPDRSHLGGAHAEGEGAQGAVAGGVAVGAHHHVAGPDVAVLGQDLVADAAPVAADVMELGDAVLGRELAHQLLVGGGLGALGRHPVVEDDGDPRRRPRAWPRGRCPGRSP